MDRQLTIVSPWNICYCNPGWMYILNKHGGRLPLLIKAVPEGSVVPYKNGNIEWNYANIK